MSGRSFIDTNILLYAIADSSDPRSATALGLVDALVADDNAVISFQVIHEICNAMLKKSNRPVTTFQAEAYLFFLKLRTKIVPSTMAIAEKALAIHHRYRYHWYDSLIVTAALTGGCKLLYSEDLQHGQVIEGMTIVNPFV
jgi:predicted nucleic acid-binding protein